MRSREDAYRAIERALDPLGVRREPAACAGHALGGIVPEAVALPSSAEQVAEVLAHAAEAGLSLVPWGGASGADPGRAPACGPPARYDLALSLARLDAILEHDADNLTLTTQGGARLFDVAHRLRPQRQVLSLGWPSAHHTLGGWVAGHRSSPKRLVYGAVRDQLLGVRLALSGSPTADGRGLLVRFGGKVLKNVAGYDISKLVIGSLGTAGVIVETTWKLFALPDEEAYWGGAFPTIGHARRFAAALMGSPLLPACIFLLDAAAAARFALLEGFPWQPGPALAWVGFDGRALATRRQIADASALAAREQGTVMVPRDRTGDAAAAYLMGEGDPKAALQVRAGVPPSLLSDLHAELIAGLTAALEGAPGEARSAAAPVESVMDYPAGRITLRVEAPPARAAALAAWIRASRQALARHQGFLVIERAPTPMRHDAGTFGEMGAQRLMRAVQAQFDPQRVLTPERLLS